MSEVVSSSPPRVVLVTGHYWGSQRRAGFHWLADAYHRLGWEVLFFTSSLSWLSHLRGDFRLKYPDLRNNRNRLCQVMQNFHSFVWFTPFHPANLRSGFLNRLSSPLFKRYANFSLGEAEDWLRSADLFIFESTPGLLLFERFKRLNPGARFVYRVSDDLRLLKNHPIVIEAERKFAPRFDLVSVPSDYLRKVLGDMGAHAELHHHAIRKDLFDKHYPNPYEGLPGPHLVFVGVSYFDHTFLEIASRLFPEWQFHIIGPIERKVQRANIHYYGEMPFVKTIPYIKWADIGLANWSYAPGAESLSDSLKIIQYTYARLPIVAPAFLRSPRSNIVFYQPGDDASIKGAIQKALEINRSSICVSAIYSWEDLALRLAEE